MPCLIHQPSYSIMKRWIEEDLFNPFDDTIMGCITFSALAQVLLTNKYLHDMALARGQSLAQMAIAWVLLDKRITSALIGTSRPEQIVELVGTLQKLDFSAQELAAIDQHVVDGGINLWHRP